MDCMVHGGAELEMTEPLSLRRSKKSLLSPKLVVPIMAFGLRTVISPHLLTTLASTPAAAAAAKSLQLCLTLCDPIDCSPPGSSIHGIFQARVLEWGAVAFSGLQLLEVCICMCVCVCVHANMNILWAPANLDLLFILREQS